VNSSKQMVELGDSIPEQINFLAAWAEAWEGDPVSGGAARMARKIIARLRAGVETTDRDRWVWKYGVIHFHTIPGFADRLHHIIEDCREAGVIADIWLNDFGQVLKEFGYKMTITHPYAYVPEPSSKQSPPRAEQKASSATANCPTGDWPCKAGPPNGKCIYCGQAVNGICEAPQK